MHIFMMLLPLIQLPRGWGIVSYHLGLMCFFTVMMTHNTRPIHGNVCSKGITVDPCISKTKGPACLGFKVFFCCELISSCPSCPRCFHVCCVNEGGRNRERWLGREKRGEKIRQIWEKCHITLSARRTQLTALPVFVEEKAC